MFNRLQFAWTIYAQPHFTAMAVIHLEPPGHAPLDTFALKVLPKNDLRFKMFLTLVSLDMVTVTWDSTVHKEQHPQQPVPKDNTILKLIKIVVSLVLLDSIVKVAPRSHKIVLLDIYVVKGQQVCPDQIRHYSVAQVQTTNVISTHPNLVIDRLIVNHVLSVTNATQVANGQITLYHHVNVPLEHIVLMVRE